ncbi:(E3-independent) E2 ubiquitin-conjugating enzyme UBE2O-like [Mytilus californianus]|uniref:(E3-independent) E2 ubiquitin-conjugating enzyme UBE2O-like n=1 Tax=Mytilus californianus TaxID=6549 RepID=UPI0022456493|nr:(E3-independent) E2 ubiquitin-conjugating enzyme UBE2O-like [Mytilus californianus]
MAQTDCAMFEEDEVCKRCDDKIIYGIVTESSEYISSDEEYDDDELLSRGTVRIIWHPDGNETVEEEKKITLVDRSLMPGDVIRRMISGKSSQRGYVQNLIVKCHLYIKGTNKYIYNVDATDLKPLREFDIDDDVSLDPWYGKVKTTSMQSRVVFPDGAQCIAEEEDLYDLDIVPEDGDSNDVEYDQEIYPGSVLTGERENLKVVKWIQETKKYHKKMSPSQKICVRVEESQINSVHVNWICRGFNMTDETIQLHQPSLIKKEDLHKIKKLGKFHHCSTQINDIMMYTIKDTDVLSEVIPGTNLDSTINELNNTRSNTQPDLSNDTGIVDGLDLLSVPVSNGTESSSGEVTAQCKDGDIPDVCSGDNDSGVCTKSEVLMNGHDDEEDVEMNDSLDTSEITESQIDENNDDADYEDIPDQTKEKRKRMQKRSAKGKRKKKKTMEFQTKFPTFEVGDSVAVVVYCTMSLATVMWQDGSVEKDVSSTELYPVHHLDEHEFFPGDFVVEAKEESDKPNYYGAVVSCDHHSRTCMVNWYKLENGCNIKTSDSPEEVSVYDIKDHPEYKFRPGDIVVAVGDPKKSGVGNHAAGQVTSLDLQGGLYVRWPDNTTSFCNPQELYLVGGDMSEYDSESDSDDFSDTDDSWETEEEEEAESENEEEVKKSTGPVRKEELESLLDRATAALSKLDDLFKTLPQSMDATQCFQEIIYIYKRCRELEKILKSSFYKEEEIVTLIEEAKKRLRKSRTEKYNKKIEELSKQLKEVSQNLEIELNGLMKTMSVTGNEETKETSIVTSESGRNEKGNILGTECKEGESRNAQNNCDKVKEVETGAGNEPLMSSSEGKTGAHNSKTTVSESHIVGADSEGGNNSRAAVSESDIPGSSSVGANVPAETGIDSDTHTLCLKICGHLQDRMKRILEEVVPRWMAEGNILIDEDMCNDISQMSVSDTAVSPVDLPEDNDTQVSSSDIQEVMSPTTPTEIPEIVDEVVACRFIQESEVLPCHKFYSMSHTPTNLKTFMTAVSKEMRLLQRCLPEGIIVRGYEDRMDLYSAMIIGSKKTPYEDAPFFFDIQLPNDYPKSPPAFHYISFCTDRLNPNLYDDGKVCVSLLGTWEGKDTETWTSNSSLLQVLVSIQGLILVDEPYYNEAGYEKHRGTQQGAENSKMYNEMAILKLVESLTNMIKNIPETFRTECVHHLMKFGPRMIQRFIYWSTNPDPMGLSRSSVSQENGPVVQGTSILKSEKSTQLSSESSENLSCKSELIDMKTAAAANEEQGQISSCGDKTANQKPVLSDVTSASANTNLSSCNDMCTDSSQLFNVEFPLFPLSRGFCITMNKKLSTLKSVLNTMIESESNHL